MSPCLVLLLCLFAVVYRSCCHVAIAVSCSFHVWLQLNIRQTYFAGSGSRGFGSRKVVLLLTDGHSNIGQEKTIPNAEKLKRRGVEVFVVAIGGQHMSGIDEMAHIASYPPANFLFRVVKVSDFFQVINLAIKEIAPDQYKILDKYVSPCSG